jgi:hypothetical protein
VSCSCLDCSVRFYSDAAGLGGGGLQGTGAHVLGGGGTGNRVVVVGNGSPGVDSMAGQWRWERGRRRWTPWRGNNAGNGVSSGGIHGGGAGLHGGGWHWERKRRVGVLDSWPLVGGRSFFAKQDEFEGAVSGSS